MIMPPVDGEVISQRQAERWSQDSSYPFNCAINVEFIDGIQLVAEFFAPEKFSDRKGLLFVLHYPGGWQRYLSKESWVVITRFFLSSITVSTPCVLRSTEAPRRVEHSRNGRPFNRINRRELNQFPYPTNQPFNTLQYESALGKVRSVDNWSSF